MFLPEPSEISKKNIKHQHFGGMTYQHHIIYKYIWKPFVLYLQPFFSPQKQGLTSNQPEFEGRFSHRLGPCSAKTDAHWEDLEVKQVTTRPFETLELHTKLQSKGGVTKMEVSY